MTTYLLDHAPFIRFGAFAAVLLAMAVWEGLTPHRVQTHSRLARWPNNLGVVVVDGLAVRLLIPMSLAGFAAYMAAQGLGLFNILPVAEVIAAIGSLIVLDLAIYAQHVAFHAAPWLWRLHRMHHSDLEFDVTTGIRFHPLEILLSVLIKMALIAVLGAPPISVLIFEVILNGTSLFNHSNIALPLWLEPIVRAVLVTPDMHRVHHSVVRAETDSNFGFNLSLWDRVFGTYRREPAAGQLGMTVGIPAFRQPGELRLDRMLTQPFREG